MDHFGEYIILKKEYTSDKQNIKIKLPSDAQKQSRYVIYDYDKQDYFEDSLYGVIPKKRLFSKASQFEVFYINETSIKSRSAVFIPYKDSDFEKAIYEMRVPFDFTLKCTPVTKREMINFIKAFSFTGRLKVPQAEFIDLYKLDIDSIVKQVVSQFLSEHGRISIYKHLLEIEQQIKSKADSYSTLIDKGIKLESIKIDPNISDEESKTQERVTQNVAIKGIINRGENT